MQRDLPTRLFHVALIALLASAWATGEAGGTWTDWHLYTGLALIALIVFRVLWGLFGPVSARFSQLNLDPRALMHQFNRSRTPPTQPPLGYTPSGSYAILALYALVLVQVTTGLFATDDFLFTGPLNPLVSLDGANELTRIHHWNFDLLLIVIAVHISVNIGYALFSSKERLAAMITGGDKQSAEADGKRDAHGRAILFVLIGIATSSGIYWFAPAPRILGF